jgi:basic membrane lipoprotein Med (substrate-binding protein (PBP1-ABC) superfamily)/DNA-binding SARP family transcriptional activator
MGGPEERAVRAVRRGDAARALDPDVEVRLLGSLEVVAGDVAVGCGPPKQRAVLALLALHANEVLPVDRLIDALWHGRPPRTAAHSIQIYVSDLRRLLAGVSDVPVIVTRQPGYQLSLPDEAIDVGRFERLVNDGARAVRAGDHTGGATALRSALALWRGEPLADVAYEEFAQDHIRRLRTLHLDAIEQLAAAQLAQGALGDVLSLADTLICDDPLRERGRELLMRALYRSGRHAEALRAYESFRSVLADELGLEPSPGLQRLQEQVLLHDPGLLPPQTDVVSIRATARNPYKGLRAFGEEDADDYFGRDALADQVIEELAGGARLIALVGPSGSGKSSVVAAGVVPRLRAGAITGSEQWVIAQMVPSAHPLDDVAAVVAGASGMPSSVLHVLDTAGARPRPRALSDAGRVVLVIDQFEELFSVADEATCSRFLQALASAASEPDGNVVVVLTLRADAYDQPLRHASFATAFTSGVINVLPMTAEELESAVVRPAALVGATVEPALLAQLVADTSDQPGPLPLLQHVLTEQFELRSGHALTLGDYRALGGVRAALARSADEIYGGLDDTEQRAAMQVLLRLVRLGQGTRDARRRVRISELTGLELDPVALAEVLERFGRRRLLSFDRDPVTGAATVELAHEALLSEWPRLVDWVERHRAALQRHSTLVTTVDEWEASGRNPDYLLTGSRLTEYERWGADGVLRLTSREREFLQRGLDRRRSEHAAAQATSRARRRLERRARRRLVLLVAAVIALTIAAVVAVTRDSPAAATHMVFLHHGGGGIEDLFESGVDRAVSEFGVIEREREIDVSLAETELRRLAADEPDLVLSFANGIDVAAVAGEHPDTHFVVVDDPVDAPNVSYVRFADHEGAYLAGAAAALMSDSGTIGFVGGVDVEPLRRFQAGYEAGALAVDPDVTVLVRYLSSPPDYTGFVDVPAAARAGRQLYEQGADVVFAAAGTAQRGVLQTAVDMSAELGRHLWAIGVDGDAYVDETWQRDDDSKFHVLTSMIKRFDLAAYDAVRDHEGGVLHPGARPMDLSNGGVGLTYSGGFLDEVRPRLDALRDQIVVGAIVVPCVPADRIGDALADCT